MIGVALAADVFWVTCGAGLELALPAWLKETVQVPVPLVIVIEAEPVPPPLQTPEVVIATGRPELAVAATPKLVP